MRNIWESSDEQWLPIKFLGAPFWDKPYRLYPLPKGKFEPLLSWDGPQAALLECRKSLKARENPDIDLQEMTKNLA